MEILILAFKATAMALMIVVDMMIELLNMLVREVIVAITGAIEVMVIEDTKMTDNLTALKDNVTNLMRKIHIV